MHSIFAFIIGYILGCFNAAYYYAKHSKIDIFASGSGNAGAANAYRLLGKRAGVTVFLIDIIKAIIAVLIVTLCCSNVLLASTAAVAVILGHTFPLQLRFRGGKGVACYIGALLALLTLKSIIILISLFGLCYAADRFIFKKSYKRVGFIVLFISLFFVFKDLGYQAGFIILAGFSLIIIKHIFPGKRL